MMEMQVMSSKLKVETPLWLNEFNECLSSCSEEGICEVTETAG